MQQCRHECRGLAEALKPQNIGCSAVGTCVTARGEVLWREIRVKCFLALKKKLGPRLRIIFTVDDASRLLSQFVD